MTTKIPGFPPVPSNLDPNTKAYLRALGEAMEVRLGLRGDPIDRAVTLRELIDSGLATQLGHVPFNPDNLGTTVDFESASAPDLSQPPAPTGLTATAAFQTVLLEWGNGNLQFRNFAFTEVHRSSTNVIGDAVLVAVIRGNKYADQVDSNSTHYYWVRHVSTSDIRGPFNATSGVVATTQKIEGTDIEPLTITNSLIANTAAIDGAKIADLDASKITTGQLSANRISVDGATIVADGSGQLKIADLGVNTAQIASAAITSAKIGSAAITSAKIGAAAITAAKIGSAAVNTLKITNGAVTNFVTGAVSAATSSSIRSQLSGGTQLTLQTLTLSLPTITSTENTLFVVFTDFSLNGTGGVDTDGVDLDVQYQYRWNSSGSFVTFFTRSLFFPEGSSSKQKFDNSNLVALSRAPSKTSIQVRIRLVDVPSAFDMNGPSFSGGTGALAAFVR